MQASSAPTKVPLPFANAGAKNTIPTASQIAITPGAASLTDGFPPLTRTPIAAGGVPPSGQDMNGILNLLSANIQWENAGAFFPYDATFSTAIGGYPKGALLLRTDGSGFWYSTTDNNTTNPDTGGAGWLGVFAGGAEAPRVSGLIGKNNSTTPASQFDFSASNVTLRNPSSGATAAVVNTGTITNNVALAGPAANGRDQAAAFTASQWIYFYYIWNPTTSTLATISSTATPAVGPTLPTGYTAWAFIGTVYFSASSALASMYARGSWFAYVLPVTVLNAGASTGLTPIAIPTVVPPSVFSPMFELQITNISVQATAGGQYSGTFLVTIDNVQNTMIQGLQGSGGASTVFGVSGSVKRLPNLSQGFSYQWSALGSSTNPSGSILCGGYSVANGGE